MPKSAPHREIHEESKWKALERYVVADYKLNGSEVGEFGQRPAGVGSDNWEK
jgi:hypothetical protein